MEIHLGSHQPVTCSANRILQAPQKIEHNSTIAQCADAAHESSWGCLCVILEEIIECFNALLICLGLKKEKTIDRLLKDPVAFLKLLGPGVRVDHPHELYRELGVGSGLRNIMAPLIDAQNRHGETILYVLCKREGETIDLPDGENLTINHEIIKHVLTKAKPSMHLCTSYHEYTVLHVVQSAATASLILDQAPSLISARDNEGRTPLLKAASDGRNEVVKCLIERDDETVYARDKLCCTALHLAATIEVARSLLEADPELLNAQTNQNPPQNPIEYARANGREDVANFLQPGEA